MMGIHHWPVVSPKKGPVTRKMFPFDDVIMSATQQNTTKREPFTYFLVYVINVVCTIDYVWNERLVNPVYDTHFKRKMRSDGK